MENTHQHSHSHSHRHRRRRKIKITPTMVLIAAIVLLMGSVLVFAAIESKRNQYSEYDAQVNSLTYQKQKLLAELEKLGPDMEKRLGNTSYMSFLFTDLDEALYTSAHPVMAETDHDLVGIMALSPNELPGLDGNITAANFRVLMDLGWGTALYWDGEGDLEEYIIYMKDEVLPPLQIEMPTTMAFKEGVYRLEYDDVLVKYGIVNAIHHNEIEIYPHIERTDPTGTVWHPGSVGWKAGMSATLLKRQIEADGGYAILEISFDNSASNTVYSYFEIEGEEPNVRADSFRTMVNLFKSSMRSGNVEVLNMENTRKKVERYYSERTVIELEHAQRRAEINSQLADIERQMTKLYYDYKGGK